MKLMPRFPEALRLVYKLDGKAASEDSTASRGTLRVSHLDNTLLSRAHENDVLLFIKAAEEHTRARKQNGALHDPEFYLYGAPSLQELRSIHSTACKKHPLSLDAFLLTKISETKTFLLPVSKRCLNTLSLFSHDSA